MDFGKFFRKKQEDPAPATEPSQGAESLGQSPTAQAAGPEEVQARVVEVLRTVYDPEIPVNIYELGLVYNIDVDQGGKVLVRMTLTSPGCPVAGSLVPEIEGKTRKVPGVTDAVVELVWDPPWDPSMMSEVAKLQLGMF
jgi:FeS assembly SUF system protein